MKKNKAVIAAVLVALMLMIPAGAWARVELIPDEHPEVIDVLEFKDITSLVYNRNLALKIAQDSLYVGGVPTGAYSSAIESLQKSLGKYADYVPDEKGNLVPVFKEEEWGASEDIYNVAYDVYILLLGQYSTMSAQKASLDASVTSTSLSLDNAGLNVEKACDSTVAAMEGLYVTYNSLNEQVRSLEAKKALLEKNIAVAKLQYRLGMSISITISAMENQVKELENSLAQLKDTQRTLVRSLNVNIGQDAEHPLRIASVPRVSERNAIGIDWVADYENNVEKSYGVRTAYISDDDDQLEDAQATYKEDMRKAHLALTEKQKTLALQQSKQEVAKKSLEIAEMKYQLGMLSEIQYLSEKNTYMDAEVAYQTTYNDFFQAYNNYEWAKAGLIVGGN